MKLEKLLKKLIEKGWRIENPKARISDVKYMYGLRELRIVYETDRRDAVRTYPIRFLVSKESGLWQFVCENELVKPVVDIISICSYSHFTDDHDDGGWDETFPEYRIIESALCDEDKLEEFLLQNINVEYNNLEFPLEDQLTDIVNDIEEIILNEELID